MSPTILNIVEISLAKSNGRCMKDAERSFTEKRRKVQLKRIDATDIRTVSLCALERPLCIPHPSYMCLVYRHIVIYFSGEPFYSSTRGFKEPRLQAHPGYGATEIRN